jgi:hypothetical protein
MGFLEAGNGRAEKGEAHIVIAAPAERHGDRVQSALQVLPSTPFRNTRARTLSPSCQKTPLPAISIDGAG